jgi:F0F1-type ATP synthase assembly protein I
MARDAREGRGISTAAELGRYAGLGLTFAATVLLFGAAGWWLDRRLSTSPWILVSALFLGAGLAFYSLLRRVPHGRSATKPPPHP